MKMKILGILASIFFMTNTVSAVRAPDTQTNATKKMDFFQPLRLKKLFQTNLTQQINGDASKVVETLATNIMNKGVSYALDIASGKKIDASKIANMGKYSKGLSGTDFSVASIDKIDKDKLGFEHIRVEQTYKGLQVVGAELIIHINNNNIYMINGAYQPNLDIDIKPSISDKEALSIGISEQDTKDNMSVSKEPSLVIYNSNLAWFYIIKHDGNTPGQWYYYVDAKNGKMMNSYNNIKHAAPSQGGGSASTVTGNRLTGEDGTVVSMQGFHETNANYFLYSFNNLWGIFDVDVNDWEQQATASWGTNDPAAVSCGLNFEDTQYYVSYVLGLNSFDDTGAFARANVHEGTNYVNAYWDGSAFYFGDGDGSTSNSLATLDISAHEYGHAITQYTSNLIYQNESGALNEAYSDIIGTTVEFFTQNDGTSTYPNASAGQSDWLMGEDAWLSGTALRDMQDPQRYGQPSYYHGTYWYTGTGDNGGVHYNSGVANFAYYLLAVGGSGTNDGHAYTITGIGEQAAAAVALRANYVYHTSSSNYADARSAWIQAAADFGYDTQTVADVWTACGVEEVVPCETAYTMNSNASYNFEDISGTGTMLSISDNDDATEAVPLDFNFGFYCTNSNTVNVNSNGTLSFTSTSARYTNQCIPGENGFEDLIAPFWDDLNPGSAGEVYVETKGTTPNRRFIVQWNSVAHYPSVGDTTFQAILYESTNNILFQYADVSFEDPNYDFGISATVGIQNDATTGTQYSCDTASLSDGQAILFTPNGTPPEEPVLIDDINSPSASSIGLGYDATRNGVWIASEDGNIYMLDATTHTLVTTISLVGKVMSPDGNTDGVEVLSNGNLLLTDYAGDGDATIDDYVFEFNPDTETMVNYWPLDGTSNTSTDGTIIDSVIDVAKGNNGHLYLTSASDNNVYEISVTNGAPGTWTTVSVTPVPVEGNAMGIGIEGTTSVLSDFTSTTVGILKNNSVVSQFSFEHSENSYNTGVTMIPGNPEQVWVTDFSTNKVGVFTLPEDEKINMSAIYYLLF